MEKWHFISIVKGLLYMITSRVEKLEKRVDELEEKQRVTSTQKFNESKNYFDKELKELDKII